MRIFHFDEQGALLGEGQADADPMQAGAWLIPAQATTMEPPPPLAGHRAVFDGFVWVQEPLPEPTPEPTPPEPTAADIRRGEIMGELFTIDQKSARPARAIALAIAAAQQPNAADVQTLADLETQAVALRAELAQLQ